MDRRAAGNVPPVIGRLTGRVVGEDPDGSVVLDVGGVGYDLVVPLGTLGRLRADEAGRVTFWVHTHVREDILALYGFADETERTAFRALLGVSNVGPKIAVAVLGALPAAELSRAIARQDPGAMKGVPGVGKKIAERLMLELRDKLPAAVAASIAPAQPGASAPRAGSGDERLKSALTGMGFKPSEADRALSSLTARADGLAFEEQVREALALLAK
jgi:Holliday junction DNA helicase RuvA